MIAEALQPKNTWFSCRANGLGLAEMYVHTESTFGVDSTDVQLRVQDISQPFGIISTLCQPAAFLADPIV